MTGQILEDPTNHVVCVFDGKQQALSAQDALSKSGIPTDQIRIISNEQLAEFVDTSSKWFADTHTEIERYQEELRKGGTLLSTPVADAESREKIHAILKDAGARLVTHFGEWITEMMK